MNESLQRFDEVDLPVWNQILDKSTAGVRQLGIFLSEDRTELQKINPERPFYAPILPSNGDPEVDAPFEISNVGSINLKTKRTTLEEYAVVEMSLWLPVKRLLGSEVELELINPVFSATVWKRDYIQSVGGEKLEGYRFGLGMDSLTPADKATGKLADPYLRLAHMIINRTDPHNMLEEKSVSATKPLFRRFKNQHFAGDQTAAELN